MIEPKPPDLYDGLHVRKLVNAHGTLTRLGGTLMSPRVTQAMHQAAQHWVDLPELLARSGEHVAALLSVEAALITSGAAAGLVTALEVYVAQDEAAEMARWEDCVAYLVTAIGQVPGVCARRLMPVGPGIRPITIPRASVSWDEAALGLTGGQAAQSLLEGEPAIAVASGPDGLVLNPQNLRPGEEEIVARRVGEVLGRHI